MNETPLIQQISGLKLPPTSIIVSACLLGINCRYDGKSKLHPDLATLLEHFFLIPVCPEQLGGLPTPRPAAEIRNGSGADVLARKASVFTNTANLDVTEAFLRGASETEKIARLLKVTTAILQQRSPSCGFGRIYQNHQLSAGTGVTAALLRNGGITIFSVD
jgi:uncharacterized protein YbbK (DUF523 family)